MTMYIKYTIALFALALAQPAFAQDAHEDAHGKQIFSFFTLEADGGIAGGDATFSWNFEGWVGGEKNKLVFKSEGEKTGDEPLEQSEFWTMYGRNFSTFWDAQVGIRFDTHPESTGYLALGVEGLVPYFFETEAHLFVSTKGDITARLHQGRELFITQTLIVEPYIEINLSTQDVAELDIGAGLTDLEFGMQTRYELTRRFAPYLDLRYERAFGKTAKIAKENGDDAGGFIASIGVKLLF